ncbi:MAG: histidine phosphatase family protein [Aquisalimonadaceae bacterium]
MRRIVLFRHGLAEEAEGGMSDMARALTEKGRRKTEKAARGLSAMLGSVDLLASSPLLRAVQTADILDEHLHAGRRQETRLLESAADPGALLEWLQTEADVEMAVLVGHEPHLGRTAALALTGEARGFLVFRKAGACLLEFNDEIAPGAASMRWFMAPSQLVRSRAAY